MANDAGVGTEVQLEGALGSEDLGPGIRVYCIAAGRVSASHGYIYRVHEDGTVYYNVSYATLALEPTFCAVALSVIALSINNTIAFARTRAGDTTPGVAVRLPKSLELFEELWKPRAPLAALTYGGSMTSGAPDLLIKLVKAGFGQVGV